jgi:hypothetical protein
LSHVLSLYLIMLLKNGLIIYRCWYRHKCSECKKMILVLIPFPSSTMKYYIWTHYPLLAVRRINIYRIQGHLSFKHILCEKTIYRGGHFPKEEIYDFSPWDVSFESIQLNVYWLEYGLWIWCWQMIPTSS